MPWPSTSSSCVRRTSSAGTPSIPIQNSLSFPESELSSETGWNVPTRRSISNVMLGSSCARTDVPPIIIAIAAAITIAGREADSENANMVRPFLFNLLVHAGGGHDFYLFDGQDGAEPVREIDGNEAAIAHYSMSQPLQLAPYGLRYAGRLMFQ